MSKKLKKEFDKEFDLKLRPHHVLGYAEHEAQPDLYYLPGDGYIKLFRKEKGDFHSDELILYWKDTIKKLHENPDLKFKYISGLDSVCNKCDKSKLCSDKKHWAYKLVQKADKDFIELMPELKPGKIYDANYLRRLFKKKGWLKKRNSFLPHF